MTDVTRSCLDCDSTKLHGKWCCETHYRKRLAAGTLPKRLTVAERFWSHVDKSDACWLWGSTVRSGYGRFTINTGTQATAHRYAYELLVGPIANGLTLDHLCRNKLCVNPAHLEPVTLVENIQRRPPTKLHRNKVKTHCPEGHAYDRVVVTESGAKRRRCMTCDRRSWAESQRRKNLRRKGLL